MLNYPASSQGASKAGDATAPLTWQVTAQSETVGPNANGIVVPGVRVYFQVSNGQSGSVFVPHVNYTADEVKQLIQDRVDRMTQIGGLSGTSTPNSLR